MHHRLAREIARIEKRYPNPLGEDELFELFRDFRYIVPQRWLVAALCKIDAPRKLSEEQRAKLAAASGKTRFKRQEEA